MPHIVLECSTNVPDVVSPDELVERVHAAAVETGVAPLDALRTRAVVVDACAVADGTEDSRFVACEVRLGPGRSLADQQRLLAAIADAIDETFGAARGSLMVSVELREIDPDRRINRNHLRDTRAASKGH